MNTIEQKEISQALLGLGLLLDYPQATLAESVRQWRREHCHAAICAQKAMAAFEKALSGFSPGELEEIYTRTFDLNPVSNPYVTAHLYGDENPERSELMSLLAGRYAQENFSCVGEAPDHLGLVLRFTPYLSREELFELAQYCLLAPVTEMLACLKADDNPYAFLLEVVLCLIQEVCRE